MVLSHAISKALIDKGLKFSWFPGHMYKATKELYARLNDIDIFIEIRDARQPYSSMNYQVDDIIKSKQKKKIVIFNKYDLCDNPVTLKAIKRLQSQGVSAMPTSAINRLNLRKQIELARLENPPKYQQTVGNWLMIGGMPNIGKSTILNTMRKQASKLSGKPISKVTKSPGETRHLFGFKINEKPLAWMVDTPGLMVPDVGSAEVGLKLCQVGCVRDKMIDKEILVNFMIEELHKKKKYKYVEHYGLFDKVKDGNDLTLKIRQRFGEMHYDRTYTRILEDFNLGKFGKVTFDEVDLS